MREMCAYPGVCVHIVQLAFYRALYSNRCLTGISDSPLDALEAGDDRQGNVAAAVSTVERICIGTVLLSY